MTDDITEISAEEIAEQVATIHRRLDDFKSWSRTISEWLESERRRFMDGGQHAEAAETLRLIQHVDSVFMRIEGGDENLSVSPDPEPEEDDEV